MALPAVGEAAYPTPDELLSQFLADVRFGYAQRGITVNVEEGSELYLRGQAFCNRLSIALANNKIATADMSPLDATGTALEELAAVFGVKKRPAAKAIGSVWCTGTGTVTIPEGFIAVAPSGAQYETPQSVTVAIGGTGAAVQIRAADAGADGNLAKGVILTWADSSIGAMSPTCTADGAIEGGADADDEEALRTRLLDRLGFPGVGGNWAQVQAWARDASAAVEMAFVYPAVRGAASYDVTLTREGTDRTISVDVQNIVAAAVLGNMPSHADLNLTSVLPQQLDVVVDLTLPLPLHAGGAGSGWKDAAPWPSTNEVPGIFAKIIGGNEPAKQITVDSTAADAPVAGKHFCVWNYATRQMVEFLIESVALVGPNYVITIAGESSSMSFIEWPPAPPNASMYCSAAAFNLNTYATEFAAAMALLGPGEKTTSVDILPRGRRRPTPDVLWPADLTTLLLAGLSNSHPEILNASYAARFETGTAATRWKPAVPATTAGAPRILTLQNLAFRRQV